MFQQLCLFCLFLLAGKVNADCQLSASDISNTNRIFAFQSNSQYYPLRVDVVRSAQSLDMICTSGNVVQTTCEPNGAFNPQLPINDCSNPIKGGVERVDDSNCPYTMYRVGYRFNGEQFLELYRSCYDPQSQTAHFVIHLAYPNNLNTPRPAQGFTTDGVISTAAAASFQAKNIYKRFEELLGPDQSYITSVRDLVFDRGHLAPSADFGFEPYMRLSNKYINIVAQFAGVNRGNWKIIENWVRKELASGDIAALQICTGGLEVLQLADKQGILRDVYLNGNSGNPVPKWLYKIIGDNIESHYAFLTYNNVYDTEIPTPKCRETKCPPSLTFNQVHGSGYSFCCDPSDFIARNVPHLADVC